MDKDESIELRGHLITFIKYLEATGKISVPEMTTNDLIDEVNELVNILLSKK